MASNGDPSYLSDVLHGLTHRSSADQLGRAATVVALLSAVRERFASGGLGGLLRPAYRRFVPDRRHHACLLRDAVAGRCGFEVGGPSAIFGASGLLPAYALAERIDNCNFAALTTWEGQVQGGPTFQFSPDKPPGMQFIGEATDLAFADTAAYDFVLTSHALEHAANPLQALAELDRIAKPGACMVLVLPHRDGTFDWRRPVTTMAHLLADQAAGVGEDDMTHLDEILSLHDLDRDPGGGDAQAFHARSLRNAENRCFHHHVFDLALAIQVVDHLGHEILSADAYLPFHIVIVSRKLPGGQRADNTRLRHRRLPGWYSPFASDGHRQAAPGASPQRGS